MQVLSDLSGEILHQSSGFGGRNVDDHVKLFLSEVSSIGPQSFDQQEIREVLQRERPDYITLSGSGEPTLRQWELALYFVIGGFIAPVAEELCFRGILYTFFRRWGIMTAMVASTAIFVMLHTIHGLPVIQIVGGIVFAMAYETSRNLTVPITIHCLGNLAIFTLSLLQS